MKLMMMKMFAYSDSKKKKKIQKGAKRLFMVRSVSFVEEKAEKIVHM